MENHLKRFLDTQQRDYATALAEIKAGRKCSQWMLYIFPQLAGLGYSDMAKRCAIRDSEEAIAYLNHPILGKRLSAISQVLLTLPANNATQIMGRPDDMKLRSAMSLFALLPEADPVFGAVLKKFFDGEKEPATIHFLS